MTFDQIERERLNIQSALDAAKTQAERNRLGQFATPPNLATDVLLLATQQLRNDEKVRFLDPAIGSGSFFSALLRTVQKERIERAEGFEIDERFGTACRDLWEDAGLKVQIADFTKAVPAQQHLFNLIICNPPYVRHHHLESAEKMRLQQACNQTCRVNIGGLAGLYCYFLGLAHAWMSIDGIAAWLIPSEFMDVNYGVQAKRYLLDKVSLLRIHRFDPNEAQFDDALVSSAVVLFRRSQSAVDDIVEFSFGGSLSEPKISKLIAKRTLRCDTKWSSLCIQGVQVTKLGVRLADLFTIRRGLATGANGFFILERQRIADLDLPMEFFKPILPSPRYLQCDEVFADPSGNPSIDQQLFLLDCDLPADDIREHYPKLWQYLEGGAAEVSGGYLCRSRSPWYSQEQRQPPPLLCTYMGRENSKSGRPFRFILNHSQAIAANVYLLLYPKPSLAVAFEKDPLLLHRVWQVLNETPLSTLLGEGRVYGGGLQKLEPKELANVPADEILALLPAESKESHVALQLSMGFF